ncbi:MAG: isochorismatase [Barrevirus sp.]|uniref:nicotinamidase n=1 Tax=Barrevirus sp. TaxID=2487763 RepID=A0A3G4ZQZ9_9VIRU|nr:MAG: isochorismatase [Barrevirus sp.]
MNKALIIMDLQNDFCNGGPIPHFNSLTIIPKINSIRDSFKHVFLCRELHQENHSSFKECGGKLQKHCIIGTNGSEFNEHLTILPDDIIVDRGTLQKFDSSSAFYDSEDTKKETNLRHLLTINGLTDLYFCGISMDTSIFSTVLDAINWRYNCYIYKDCIAYLNEEKCEANIKYLEQLGVKFI